MKYVQITPDIYPFEESSKKKSFTLQKFLTQSSYKTDLEHIICRNKLIEKKELELIAVQLSKSINQKVILHTQGNFEEFLQGPTVSLIDQIEKPFLDYVEGLHITSGDLLRIDKEHLQFPCRLLQHRQFQRLLLGQAREIQIESQVFDLSLIHI